MRKTVTGLIAVVGVFAAWLWSVRDIEAVPAPMFASAMPPVDGQENGFSALEALAAEVAGVVSGAAISGRQALDRMSLEGTGDTSLRGDPILHQLPDRLGGIIQAARLRAPDGSALGAPSKVSRQTLDLMRVILAGVQDDLAQGDVMRAWASARQGWTLCTKLHDHSVTFADLITAHGCQEIVARGLIAGLDSGRWPPASLRAFTELPDSDAPQELMRALQADFAALFKEAPQSPDTQGLLGKFAYHPNRSRKAWLDAMAPVFAALRARDVPQAYRAVVRSHAALREGGGLRNAAGYRLVAIRIASYEAPLAQTVNSQVQRNILRLRSAAELHRLEHGSWPSTLGSLASSQLQGAFRDPWSAEGGEFQYRTAPRRVYSVGPNQRDDGGSIASNLLNQSQTDDYGLRFP